MAAYVGRLPTGEIVIGRLGEAPIVLSLQEARHVHLNLAHTIEVEVDARVRDLRRSDFKAE